MKKLDLQYPISGFPEFLPHEQLIFDQLLEIVRKQFLNYGFLPIETNAIERSSVLNSYGEQGIVYSVFKDVGDGMKHNEFGLRYDLTLPLARYVAQNLHQLHFPFKRYQIQKVWRGEKAQAGRYHEFYQCDIDVLFSKKVSVFSEAELIKLMFELLNKIGIGKAVVKIGNNALLKKYLLDHGVCEAERIDVSRILKKINTIGVNNVKTQLSEKLPTCSPEVINEIVSFCCEEYSEIEEFKSRLDQLGYLEFSADIIALHDAIKKFNIDMGFVKICPGLIRGMHYYTGNVYEIELLNYPEFGHICAGGRYDDLVKNIGEKNVPGLGISFGLTKLFNRLLKDRITKHFFSYAPSIFIANLSEKCFSLMMEVSETLRNIGMNVDIFPEVASVGEQMDYADKKGHTISLLITEQGLCDDMIIAKRMKDGTRYNFKKEDIKSISLILERK